MVYLFIRLNVKTNTKYVNCSQTIEEQHISIKQLIYKTKKLFQNDKS